MLIGLIITSIIFVIFLPFLVVGFSGDVYYPTAKEKVKDMLELIDVKRGMKVYDLGSGDGRIVYAFAKAGAKAYGVEINIVLYFISKIVAMLMKLPNAIFIRKSFWNVNVSDADAIALFIIPPMMNRMVKKLKKELKPGTRIVSYAFECPELKFIKKKNNVFLYEV